MVYDNKLPDLKWLCYVWIWLLLVTGCVTFWRYEQDNITGLINTSSHYSPGQRPQVSDAVTLTALAAGSASSSLRGFTATCRLASSSGSAHRRGYSFVNGYTVMLQPISVQEPWLMVLDFVVCQWCATVLHAQNFTNRIFCDYNLVFQQ